jgi:hypothetical protein
MACTLSLKSFEENAGIAAPGWTLTGKTAAGAWMTIEKGSPSQGL